MSLLLRRRSSANFLFSNFPLSSVYSQYEKKKKKQVAQKMQHGSRESGKIQPAKNPDTAKALRRRDEEGESRSPSGGDDDYTPQGEKAFSSFHRSSHSRFYRIPASFSSRHGICVSSLLLITLPIHALLHLTFECSICRNRTSARQLFRPAFYSEPHNSRVNLIMRVKKAPGNHSSDEFGCMIFFLPMILNALPTGTSCSQHKSRNFNNELQIEE